MKQSYALGVAVIAVVVTATLAVPTLAASLYPASSTLGSGKAVVSSCDSDGVAAAPNLSGSNVVSVTVSGIEAACAGFTLKATVTGSTSFEGTVVVPGGGGSATATLAASVAVVQSIRFDIVIAP